MCHGPVLDRIQVSRPHLHQVICRGVPHQGVYPERLAILKAEGATRPRHESARRPCYGRVVTAEAKAPLSREQELLANVVPDSRLVQFPRLNHGGSWNADRGGKPEVLAQELKRFFAV